jgi:hypothetical protein
MRRSRFSSCLLLCAVGVLLTTSLAGAQSGIPDVPIGPGPSCVAPARVEPPASPASLAPWSGLALRPLVQQFWSFLSVVPVTPQFHPVAMREPRGWGLSVSRAAADRLIRR